MRPSLALFSKSGSSKQWLARQARDPYVKARVSSPSHYRSRSAFKLKELDKHFNIIKRDKTGVVVDLGAAPGGWSQVAADILMLSKAKSPRIERPKNEDAVEEIISETETGIWSAANVSPVPTEETGKEGEEKMIIALDLLPITPIRGVRTIQCNFLTKGEEAIKALLPTPETKVDVVLSDMAPNMSGNRIRDEAAGLEICEAVYRFAARHLRVGGSMASDGGYLVLKHFANESTKAFYLNVLKRNFFHTYVVKPDASRGESSEYYFISKGFKGDPYLDTNDGF
ncbi:hypothetical protein ACEPAG_2763 [Sanghuangporus baumii]